MTIKTQRLLARAKKISNSWSGLKKRVKNEK